MMLLNNRPHRWLLPAVAYGLTALMLIGCDRGAPRPEFICKTEWMDSGVWMKVDTHIHTKFSDGSHSVSVVAAKAREFGCDAIAITDHGDQNLKGASLEYAEAIEVARREHPELLILAGLEWNVPPWKGDTHATVLMPGGPDEFLQLADFKSQFDDFERTDLAEEHLAAHAIQWLESIETADDSRPVVILNHPSRKTVSAGEAGQQFQTMLDDSVVTIGFEGAPGHQKGKQLGAYKGPVMLMDRWDPVAAEVGGVWDQQLGSGSDVWGALATSDFHQESDDYWPGEFSETWVYAPERTSAGVLSALRAGSFFGSHGGIVRELEIAVVADGLERPARAGESISATSGVPLTISVTGLVSAMSVGGQPARIDAIELILTDSTGTQMVTLPGPFASRFKSEHRMPLPGEGVVIRARGRQIVPDAPDLLFYTNPVRVVDAGAQPVAIELARELVNRYRWRGLVGAALIVWVFVALVARIAAGIRRSVKSKKKTDLAESSRHSPSGQQSILKSKQATQPNQQPPRARHFAMAAGLCAAFLVYGSLVPFSFQSVSFADAIEKFQSLKFTSSPGTGRLDWSLNFMLTIPIAAFGLGTLLVDRSDQRYVIPMALLAFVGCVLVSVAVEFSQIWFAGRVPSGLDIAAQTFGAGTGVGFWLVTGRRFTTWLRSFFCMRQPAERIEWLLQAYVVGLLIYSIFPMDFILTAGELFEKLRLGRIELIPFTQTYGSTGWMLYSLIIDIILYVPVGMCVASVWKPRGQTIRATPQCLLIGAVLVVTIEVLQLFVFSRVTSSTDLLSGMAGVYLGTLAWYAWRRDEVARTGPDPYVVRSSRWWIAGAMLYPVVLFAQFWAPFEWTKDPAIIKSRIDSFISVPFAQMHDGSSIIGILSILRKILWFAPLGVLAANAVRCVQRSTRFGWFSAFGCLLIAAVAITVEAGQILLPRAVADLTDALIFAGSGIAAFAITLQVCRSDNRVQESECSAIDEPRHGKETIGGLD